MLIENNIIKNYICIKNYMEKHLPPDLKKLSCWTGNACLWEKIFSVLESLNCLHDIQQNKK